MCYKCKAQAPAIELTLNNIIANIRYSMVRYSNGYFRVWRYNPPAKPTELVEPQKTIIANQLINLG